MATMLVNGKTYTFATDYREDAPLRHRLNELTRQTYGFDFERWYQSGNWTEVCVPYSLLDGDRMVSNILVNLFTFHVLGQEKNFVQLGTVMTDTDYRHLGLSRALMERVLADWQDNCDMIYLFANDSVLDFYPKFGFVPVKEYQATKAINKAKIHPAVRKMDLSNENDLDLLRRTAEQATVLSRLSMRGNAGLILFYCNYMDAFSFRDNLYEIEGLNAIAIAGYEEDALILHDVLATREVVLDEVIASLATEQTRRVVLGFLPIDCDSYELTLSDEPDTTLFVSNGSQALFEQNKLRFSVLSHT